MSRRPLGQHFLIDRHIIAKIIESADLHKEDRVLEIGPGRGAITLEMASKAGHITAVEVDKSLAERLPKLPNLEVINDDFLKLNLEEVLRKELPENGRWKVVANLPYYITTPIIEKLLVEGHPFIDRMIIMIQKEVADRIQSLACRNSSALSYFVGCYAQAKTLFHVKPGSFNPPPQVDSSVMSLNIYRQPPIKSPIKLVLSLTRAAFNVRRKTLRKSLKGIAASMNADLEESFQLSGLEGNSRPEELTLEQFSDLAAALQRTSAANCH
ncbi:MAG: 16S rRNA (adenine(1518)-N(6)/adenine(1519)-N(6))-dimethyltransferase RsmA [Candidatus Bruticola sp.]